MRTIPFISGSTMGYYYLYRSFFGTILLWMFTFQNCALMYLSTYCIKRGSCTEHPWSCCSPSALLPDTPLAFSLQRLKTDLSNKHIVTFRVIGNLHLVAKSMILSFPSCFLHRNVLGWVGASYNWPTISQLPLLLLHLIFYILRLYYFFFLNFQLSCQKYSLGPFAGSKENSALDSSFWNFLLRIILESCVLRNFGLVFFRSPKVQKQGKTCFSE